MYRIVFDPQLGKFVIEVSVFGGLWWRRVQSIAINSQDSVTDDIQFPTYLKAYEHVINIGLDKLYEDRSANKYRQYMAEGGVK